MLTNELSLLLQKAFANAGYDEKYGNVVVSSRPDLCQFQCNGAMPAAKEYKKAPFMISDDVIVELQKLDAFDEVFENATSVKPGFINMNVKDSYLVSNTNKIMNSESLGVNLVADEKCIVMDYGGPNVAKPLHIGHLRTALIGESIKRILTFMGYDVISDVHLGDWGKQMGMIISELERIHPDLPYFDESFEGDYPSEAPFTLTELEELYPRVSKLCKEDKAIDLAAREATFALQNEHRGYRAIWQHIVNISVEDIKKNYGELGVSFDYWYGESDAHDYIDGLMEKLRSQNAVYESDGALVVDVAKEDDKKEVPPLLLYKSDGSVLYGTTDLGTISQRVEDFDPSRILYVVDNRQANHFTQVFRCAEKYGVVKDGTSLEHIGFGTMNGKDGKPFKTRDGGIIRLSELIGMVKDNARNKILANLETRETAEDDYNVEEITHLVGMATLKFADLSNFRTKDYIFDIEKFSSFEGKTGPYILYFTVRIKNILKKLEEKGITEGTLLAPKSQVERDILLKLDTLESSLALAVKDSAPNNVTEYVYELATLVSSFYHTHHIMNETDEAQQKSWYILCKLILKTLETCLDLLGIQAPDKM